MKSKILIWVLIGVIITLLGVLAYFSQHAKQKIVTRTSTIEVPVSSVAKDEIIKDYVERTDSLAAALLEKSDEVERYTRIISRFRQDTLRIPIKADTVYRTVFKEKEKEKIVERVIYSGFNYADKTLSITGKVTPTELKIDSLIVNSRISLLQVNRKEKGFLFFKKRKSKVIAVSSDPRISLTGITELEVEAPKDNYLKGFGHGFATGLVGGVGATAAIKK